MKHTLSILVENRFGVLARVAGLFSARGYNIDSLTVSETEDSTISRMTIVVNAKDETILEQIKKQLNKLIDVIRIADFAKNEYIEKELIFTKIVFGNKKELELIEKFIEETGSKSLEKRGEYCLIEIVGGQDRIKKFLEGLKTFKVLELVRSGRIAIAQ